MLKIHSFEDFSKSFIVTKKLEGAAIQTQKLDTRAPITLQRLQLILQELKRVCASSYEVHLFRKRFCLAFFGFLRVGELTCKSLSGHNPQPLQNGDIEIAYVDGSRMVNPGGKNLTLQSRNVTILWFGIRGMRLQNFDSTLEKKLKSNPLPNYLVVH